MPTLHKNEAVTTDGITGVQASDYPNAETDTDHKDFSEEKLNKSVDDEGADSDTKPLKEAGTEDQPQISEQFNHVDESVPTKSIHPMMTRLKSGAIRPKSVYIGLTEKRLIADPVDTREAFKIPCWKEAIELEYEALVKNNTRSLVPYQGQKLIYSKWVFRTKYSADGSIERHKTRLVAKGYQQDLGIDAGETFSPIA